jgi:hypothetical protein
MAGSCRVGTHLLLSYECDTISGLMNERRLYEIQERSGWCSGKCKNPGFSGVF